MACMRQAVLETLSMSSAVPLNHLRYSSFPIYFEKRKFTGRYLRFEVFSLRSDLNYSVGVDPKISSVEESPVRTDHAFTIALAGLAAGGWFVWRQLALRAAQASRVGQSLFTTDTALAGTAGDGREYRMALARTRQAVAVHRAVGFLHTGNTARAMVELRRALHENSVCRAPLLNTQHGAEEMQQLYRLHLQHTAQPADFAILLQLRTMLDLDFEVAEKIERELMEEGSAYSI